MRRSDGGEMPSVKRDDRVRIETCCKSDQAGIGSAEREVESRSTRSAMTGQSSVAGAST